MSGKSYLNAYLYILLIEKKLDGFSVPTLRDELLKITDRFEGKTDPRKFVYRHLLQLEKQGLLITKGSGRKKTYHKTDLFRGLEFVSKEAIQKKTTHKESKVYEKSSTVDELLLEKSRCEAELELVLAEVEEYQLLTERLPEKKNELLELAELSRESSVRYLAKVNTLNRAIRLCS